MRLKDIATDVLEWQLISIRDDRELVRDIQQQLAVLGFKPGVVDGVWGAATQSAYQGFARTNNLDATMLSPASAKLLLQARPATPPSQPPAPTPRPAPTPPPPPASPTGQKLTAEDYRNVARLIGCDVAAVRAVVEIESSGSGFLSDGRPKILFEAQWFSEFTNGKFDTSNPDISSPRWNPRLYVGGVGEWARIEKAIKLDRPAALKSASWGLGQVMGFNFKPAGYTDVESFVKDMYLSEGKQLMAMFNFIKSQKLDRFLVSKDWAGFARAYNGEGYRQNRYDEKLAAAFQKWVATT
jgi:peptidoglycan hydrolase-like protein with peptidoglycan-binding domain